MKEVIVCAAIRWPDSGVIIAGVRHFDMIMHNTITAIYGENKPSCAGVEQGFLNQFGKFRGREAALLVARAAGQVKEPKSGNPDSDELFSEDLY